MLQTSIFYSIYSAARDENLFPDPLNFDPDRWKRDERNAFAFQPFGFGPRACYGKHSDIKHLMGQYFI